MTEHALALAFLGGALLAAIFAGSRPRRRRRRSCRPFPSAVRAVSPLREVELRLRAVPFDRMTFVDQRRLVDLLLRIDVTPVPPEVHVRIRLLLAEMTLVLGDREASIAHFRAALEWDPNAPVRRTLERLERPHPLSFISRPAA